MQVEITSAVVNERSGNKNGKDWNIRTQTGYAFIPDQNGCPQPYPQSITIDLKKDQPAYQPGLYQVADSSFFVGDYGKLSIGRLMFSPVAASVKQAA